MAIEVQEHEGQVQCPAHYAVHPGFSGFTSWPDLGSGCF